MAEGIVTTQIERHGDSAATEVNGSSYGPELRLALRQDRISVLADAMRGLAADPAAPGTVQRLAVAERGCTGDEYEAAWDLVRREQPPASVSPAEGPAAPAKPQRDPVLRGAFGAFVSRLRSPNGDTVITWAMAATVAIVAIDAAIVSYSHIYALATGAQGSGVETGIQPRLLPLSIDGVIAEASLVLLYAARHKLDAPKLARFMLALGIAATVAANVVHGLPSSMLPPVAHIVISAFLSAWPAGAFIGSVEMAMQLVRATRDVADTEHDSDDDKGSDTGPAKDHDTGDDRGDEADGARKPRRRRSAGDPVTAAIRRHPDWDDDKIAAKCEVSKRTVQRRRSVLEKAGDDNQ